MKYELRHVTDEDSLQDIFRLRHEVFTGELGRPDRGVSILTDEFDAGAIHVLVRAGSIPAGSVRFLPNAPQLSKLAGNEMEAFFKKGSRLLEINCFVVQKRFRSTKVGQIIIRHNYLYPFRAGYDSIVCAVPATQTRLLSYYKLLGWRPFGRGNFSYDFSEPTNWILMHVPLRSFLVMVRFWLLLPLLFTWRSAKRAVTQWYRPDHRIF